MRVCVYVCVGVCMRVCPVRSCVGLQVLELERVSGLDQQGAGELLCREGLQQLHTLTLTSTPVTTETLLHLHSESLSSDP